VSLKLLKVASDLALLEGCNEVARVAKFRLAQSVLANAALWGSLAAGLGLWSMPIFTGVQLAMLLGFLLVRERKFFGIFRAPPAGAKLHWKQDLLPMQWRLAIQGLFGYLSFPLFTILVYLHLGAVEAGRMGMTLQIMTGIQSFALVFLLARAPEFALLAAAGNKSELIASARQAALRSMGVMTTLCAMVILGLWFATRMEWPQVPRVLGIGAFIMLSAGIVLTAPVQAIAIYLRAHKRELLTVAGVAGGLCYGAFAWLAVRTLGAQGVAASYLLVTALVVLPITALVLRSHHARA